MRAFNVMVDGPMKLFNEKIANDMVSSMVEHGVICAHVDLPEISKAWFDLGVGCCEWLFDGGVHVLTGSPMQWLFKNEEKHWAKNENGELDDKVLNAFKESIAETVFVLPEFALVREIYPDNPNMIKDVCWKNISFMSCYMLDKAPVVVVQLLKPENGITPEKALVCHGPREDHLCEEVAYDEVGKYVLKILQED